MQTTNFQFFVLIALTLLLSDQSYAQQNTTPGNRQNSSEDLKNEQFKKFRADYRKMFQDLFLNSITASLGKIETRLENFDKHFNALNNTVNNLKQDLSNKTTGISETLKTVQEEVRQQGITTTKNTQSLANTIANLSEIAETQRNLKAAVLSNQTRNSLILESIQREVRQQWIPTTCNTQPFANTIANLREIADSQRNLTVAGPVPSVFLNSKSVSSILNCIKTLDTELERNRTYSGLVSVMMRQSNNSWTIHEACQIYKIPQLYPLKSRIPQNIKIIFSEERKAIETRQWSRRLSVQGGVQTTRNYDSSGHKHWKFFPTDDCNYFVVKNMEINTSYCNSASPNRGWNDIMSNIGCHWTIVPQSSGYYKFIERASNQALEANDAGYTFNSEISEDASQDWELIEQ